MNRVILSSVLCLAMAGLSCRILPERDLDSLAAHASHTPVVAVATELPQAMPRPIDAEVLVVLEHLESRHTGLSRTELPALAELIVSESRRHDLDPALALAVIRVESGCFNYAVSHVGAMGLMQLMPATGRELAEDMGIDWQGKDTLFDPRLNVRMGLAYLKQLTDRFGDTETALAAYNWGPGRIGRRLRRGESVPQLYATQVMRTLQLAMSDDGTS